MKTALAILSFFFESSQSNLVNISFQVNALLTLNFDQNTNEPFLKPHVINYPFGEESFVNVENSANQSNYKEYHLEIFCVHFTSEQAQGFCE